MAVALSTGISSAYPTYQTTSPLYVNPYAGYVSPYSRYSYPRYNTYPRYTYPYSRYASLYSPYNTVLREDAAYKYNDPSVLLTLAAILATTSGTALLETGQSAQYRSEDNLGNYGFGYNEDHTTGGTFRREVGDALGNVAGSYGLKDADGRVRIVNYIANDDGFKADIRTNEPGVFPDDPADATINKPSLVLANTAAVPIVQPVVETAPAVAVHTPIVAVPEPDPIIVRSNYAFPPVSAPVAIKQSTVVVDSAPVAVAAPAPVYSFPARAAYPYAKSSIAIAETAPLAYQFPVPAAVPVAKTSTIKFQPVAKKTVAVVDPAPVAITEPLAYSFPAPAAVPVAKTSTIIESAPVFRAPVAYSAPIPYARPVVPVAPAYVEPVTTRVSYASQVINHAPAAYAVRSPNLVYSRPIAPVVKSYNPYGLYSPVVNYGGPVVGFNNIAYPGYPWVKK